MLRAISGVGSSVDMRLRLGLAFGLFVIVMYVACGGENRETPNNETPDNTTMETSMSSMGTSMAPRETNDEPRGDEIPDNLTRGLLITYSPFDQNEQGNWVVPQPARLEMLTRRNGEWSAQVITDEDSNVFHKAMVYDPPGDAAPGVLTIGGMEAYVKLWRRVDGDWQAETLWHENFGGERNRMRDVEIAHLYPGGQAALAIATHDQGIFATIRPDGENWNVTQSARHPNTFVHEVEIGNLNGDGNLEVYTTPSEPNTMQGGTQSGQVLRYIPAENMEGTVVADLGNRHAKEIWVGDADGDGTDELYVSVEGLTRREGGSLEVIEPVEIRRYDADTPPDQGVVIARIEGDHLMRFLTVGDIDGDGDKEMVAASFSRGLWLLRPGSNPRSEWSKESIDRESGGFEHASILADLDGDGTDELYVSSDNHGELRRYVWINGSPRRSVIHRRAEPRSMITWNLMPAPVELIR